MECLTAANGFVRIRYRSALPWNTSFHSISIPFSYRAQLHHPLLPRESFIAIHIRRIILLVQGADKNLKDEGDYIHSMPHFRSDTTGDEQVSLV